MQSHSVDERPNTNLITICQNGRLWNGYVWLRLEPREGVLWRRRQIFGLKRMLGLFWAAERLLVSEVVICCMKFVTVSISRLSGWRQIKGLSFSLLYGKQLSHSLLQTQSFCSLMSLHSIFFRKTISRVSPISIIYLVLLIHSAIYLKTHADFSAATFRMLIQTVNEKSNCFFFLQYFSLCCPQQTQTHFCMLWFLSGCRSARNIGFSCGPFLEVFLMICIHRLLRVKRACSVHFIPHAFKSLIIRL